MTRTISNPGFSAKDPGEIIFVGFEFSALTTTPSSPVVTAARHAGTADATPSSILSGAPSINGTKVVQKLVGGVLGTDYLLTCQVDAPDGSRYILTGVIPVRAA